MVCHLVFCNRLKEDYKKKLAPSHAPSVIELDGFYNTPMQRGHFEGLEYRLGIKVIYIKKDSINVV